MALLHPESDLSMSVIVMGASVLEILSREKQKETGIIIDDLLAGFLKRDKRRTLVNFYAVLEFLYTIGVVEHENYHIRIVKTKLQADMFGQEDFPC